jgi:hypothetical protein
MWNEYLEGTSEFGFSEDKMRLKIGWLSDLSFASKNKFR